jgi:hypothetical protein
MQGNEERGGEWWYSSRVELEWPAGVGVAESSATDKHVQDGKKESRRSKKRGQRRRITETDQSNPKEREREEDEIGQRCMKMGIGERKEERAKREKDRERA